MSRIPGLLRVMVLLLLAECRGVVPAEEALVLLLQFG